MLYICTYTQLINVQYFKMCGLHGNDNSAQSTTVVYITCQNEYKVSGFFFVVVVVKNDFV